MVFYAGCPMVIAVIALLINGTDYLAVGLLALLSGLVAYFICCQSNKCEFDAEDYLYNLPSMV